MPSDKKKKSKGKGKQECQDDSETVCVPSPFDGPNNNSNNNNNNNNNRVNSKPRSSSQGHISYGESFVPFGQTDSYTPQGGAPPPSFSNAPRSQTSSSTGVVYGTPDGGYGNCGRSGGGYPPPSGYPPSNGYPPPNGYSAPGGYPAPGQPTPGYYEGGGYGGGGGSSYGGVAYGGGGGAYGGGPYEGSCSGYGGGGPSSGEYPGSSAPEMKDDDFPVYFADEPDEKPFEKGQPNFASMQQGESQGRSRTESMAGMAPLDIRTCPVCKSWNDDPLMTLVIRCPACDNKYCCFCLIKLPDGLPCGKKFCRKKTKAFWRQEDQEFAEYNVQPMKVGRAKKAKRGMQNAGYGVGVGVCGIASATMVCAGIAGVPFTAGLSLALIPAAAAPVAGGKMALDRRKRWITQCKDKRRQTVRSQIIQSGDFDASGAEGEASEAGNASAPTFLRAGTAGPPPSSGLSSQYDSTYDVSSAEPPSYQPDSNHDH